jgi:glycerol-3-phosphate dehydrogenase (NAD(P)+)
MKNSMHNSKIVFIGSGAIATALGTILAADNDLEVCLLSIERDVVDDINQNHINIRHFPSTQLHPRLAATMKTQILKGADLIFLAIPSTAITNYLKKNKNMISGKTAIINLAKGFGDGFELIPDCIAKLMSNPVGCLKGPSFAREIINKQPTALTLATTDKKTRVFIEAVFKGTPIHLDYTTDLKGVEYASILKNIYAIIIGIVDANFDSPNLRSLVLSKAINEMRQLIKIFGGQQETIFKYCGFGDFSLTALNDLSRNRTLGLLIGKGFFTQDISEKVVLEGKIAVQVFYEELRKLQISSLEYPLLAELFKVFNTEYAIGKFVNNILND